MTTEYKILETVARADLVINNTLRVAIVAVIATMVAIGLMEIARR